MNLWKLPKKLLRSSTLTCDVSNRGSRIKTNKGTGSSQKKKHLHLGVSNFTTLEIIGIYQMLTGKEKYKKSPQ